MSPSQVTSEWLREIRLGHGIEGGGVLPDVACVTLAGCVPSPLGKISQPQLCLHVPTGYVTQRPADIFPGRESECEMMALPLLPEQRNALWVNMEKSDKPKRWLASASLALLLIVTAFHHFQQ